MSHFSQTFSVDFLDFLLKKATFEEVKEICEQIHLSNKKFNIVMKKNKLIEKNDLFKKFRLRNMLQNI